MENLKFGTITMDNLLTYLFTITLFTHSLPLGLQPLQNLLCSRELYPSLRRIVGVLKSPNVKYEYLEV